MDKKEELRKLPEGYKSYASYSYDHVENIISKLRDMICDVEYSLGMSKASKDILLKKSLDSLDFLKKLFNDSKKPIGHVEFISYSDDKPCPTDPIEDCKDDEMP